MIKLSTKDSSYYFLMETETNKYLGRCLILKYADRYELWNVLIYYGFQRKGYATLMLEEIIKRYKRYIRTDKPLILYVYKSNDIAIKLYEKLGFEITREMNDDIWQMQFIEREV